MKTNRNIWGSAYQFLIFQSNKEISIAMKCTSAHEKKIHYRASVAYKTQAEALSINEAFAFVDEKGARI